jgi:protein-L-isoaspartate(D-aspartate) O-methyltransferase
MNREGALRDALVAHLQRAGILRDPRITAAMRAVERHRFVPGVAVQEAYEDKALSIKEHAGTIISSISQPSMVAHMLELLAVRPSDRVLEIGTGSGYNAALLAELAPNGSVLSVEIERDLLATAATTLHALRYGRVELMSSERLTLERRQFDRIIVTARALDIDELWWRLLAPGGRIVVPLDIGYGGERAVGFVRDGERLRSIGSYACSFVDLRGAADARGLEMFFRSSDVRYSREPNANVPLKMIAIERDRADSSLLAEADAVVARPHTLFAVTRTS